VTAQIEICSLFTAASDLKMLSLVANGRKPGSEEIEDAKNGAD